MATEHGEPDFIIAEDCGCKLYHLYPDGTWKAESDDDYRRRLQGAYEGKTVLDRDLLFQKDHESLEKKIAIDISDLKIPPVDGEERPATRDED